MNLHRSVIIYFIIFTALCSSKSTDNAARISPDHKLSEDELAQDIDYFFETIHEVHPDFHENSKLANSLRLKLDSLKNLVNDSLTRGEFFPQLAPAIPSLEDSHTRLNIPWNDLSYYLENGGLVFPFDIIFAEEQL